MCVNFISCNRPNRTSPLIESCPDQHGWSDLDLGIFKNTQLFSSKIQCISSICMSINYVGPNTSFLGLEFKRKHNLSLPISSSQPTSTPNHIQGVQCLSPNSQVSRSPSQNWFEPDVSMTAWATIGGARRQGLERELQEHPAWLRSEPELWVSGPTRGSWGWHSSRHNGGGWLPTKLRAVPLESYCAAQFLD